MIPLPEAPSPSCRSEISLSVAAAVTWVCSMRFGRQWIPITAASIIAFADAGCSFMGILTPAKSITSATNMGGCISFASGAADAGSEVPVLALCGDGGFRMVDFLGWSMPCSTSLIWSSCCWITAHWATLVCNLPVVPAEIPWVTLCLK